QQFPLPTRAGEPEAVDAGPEQQPPADRPVEAGELREIPRHLRQARDYPAVFAVGYDLLGHRVRPTVAALVRHPSMRAERLRPRLPREVDADRARHHLGKALLPLGSGEALGI